VVGAGSASGGGISANSGNSEWPSVALDGSGLPYVAWMDATPGDDQIYIKRYDGASWVVVGAGSASGKYTTVPCGFVVTMGDKRVYHTGDTALTMDMQLLEGRVDVMCLPIGDNYTMGVEDGARAVAFVKPKVAIPMHWGTFPLIATDPQQFKREVGARAEVVILQPGQTYSF
jgi:L-ascorbate metabolism protein UlaG (beta-lactamase superfamily)